MLPLLCPAQLRSSVRHARLAERVDSLAEQHGEGRRADGGGGGYARELAAFSDADAARCDSPPCLQATQQIARHDDPLLSSSHERAAATMQWIPHRSRSTRLRSSVDPQYSLPILLHAPESSSHSSEHDATCRTHRQTDSSTGSRLDSRRSANASAGASATDALRTADT